MTIADVSKQLGFSQDTLRYYEKIGLIPPVKRNKSGIRDYDALDLRRIEFIKCMRDAGLMLEVLIEYMALVRQGEETVAARKDILVEQRNQLTARMEVMQKTLDKLDHKISVYEDVLLKNERTLSRMEELV